MIYQKTITTVSNTLKSQLMITKLYLCKGLIYKVNINFPPGSCGLVGVAINYNGSRIYPIDDQEFFTGNNYSYDFDDTMRVDKEPYVFDIYTYNEDTLYNHKIAVCVGLSSEEELQFRYIPFNMFDMLDTYYNSKKEISKQTLKDKLISLTKRK